MSANATQADPLPVLLNALLADSGLVAAVTGGEVRTADLTKVRIYVDGLPSPLVQHATDPKVLPPTIVIQGSGLFGNTQVAPMQGGRIELRCYDTSRAKARALWYRALNVLRAKTPRRVSGMSVEIGLGHTGPSGGQEGGDGYIIQTGMVPFVAIGSGV